MESSVAVSLTLVDCFNDDCLRFQSYYSSSFWPFFLCGETNNESNKNAIPKHRSKLVSGNIALKHWRSGSGIWNFTKRVDGVDFQIRFAPNFLVPVTASLVVSFSAPTFWVDFKMNLHGPAPARNQLVVPVRRSLTHTNCSFSPNCVRARIILHKGQPLLVQQQYQLRNQNKLLTTYLVGKQKIITRSSVYILSKFEGSLDPINNDRLGKLVPPSVSY